MQTSFVLRLSGALALAALVSACDQGYQTGLGAGLSPDAQRAAGGAVAGAVIAKAVDGKVATGALIGAAGGALCDDLGVCSSAPRY